MSSFVYEPTESISPQGHSAELGDFILQGHCDVGGQHGDENSSDIPLLTGIVALLVLFTLATFAGWTTSPAAVSHHEATHPTDPAPDHPVEKPEHLAEDAHHHGATPHVLACLPFLLLLGSIAVLPLFRATEHWWESNTNRLMVAVGLALVTLFYYGLIYPDGGISAVWQRLDHAILKEYIPFIVLLFALYSISGGVRIEGNLVAKPLTNTTFILLGGLLASFIGTTGAAMLLIRPLLETNRGRRHVQHTVVFFIFVVCNCGGCLLPIGDPPLFLGYLQGVPFLWTLTALWQPWLLVNASLLTVYLMLDLWYYYPREDRSKMARADLEAGVGIRVRGLALSAPLLLGVILSVAILDPNKAIPGTDFYPWVYLRESIQLALIGISTFFGSKAIRVENRFNYHAIIEVAALFVGIFICMQPALEILNQYGPQLGINTPQKFFWITGGLSAVLDNAPTYLVFFQTADAQFGAERLVDSLHDSNSAAYRDLMAISLGAVFMGAMTYIGNGPNFMVRAIAEESGVRMPSFFGYVIFYSLPILLPVMGLTAVIFLW
ncbi:MAG: sodium:proton antiporter [Pirellulaceae bacterium]